MPDTQNTQKTFNSVYFDDVTHHSSPESLHSFPSLPVELRMRIWNFALEQTRLITISLRRVKKATEKSNHHTNHVKYDRELSSDSPYRVVSEDHPFFTPLLWTCSEARHVALSYYRLRVPTVPQDIGSPQFYLNPDHDRLCVQSFISSSLLAHFLSDLVSYDPRGIGLQHLALYRETAVHELKSLKPPSEDSSSSPATTHFREAIQNLQSLWFIHLLGNHTRIMVGPLSGIPGNYQFGLNRSVPILPKASRFTLLGPDPRPIEQDMKKLTVGNNPRLAAQAWEDMERRFGIGVDKTTAPQREISYILSVCALEGDSLVKTGAVQGPKSLDRYLRKEKEVWEDWEEKITGARGKTGTSQVLSAAGFWVFPADTFDQFPQNQSKNVLDMTGRRPTLGLFTF